MRLLLLVMILITFSSCQNKIKAKFEIVNKTETTIDSINITSFDDQTNPKHLTLRPGESQIYWYDMTELPKVDGDYLLTYKDKGINRQKRFGYFTNGYPLKKVTNIEIFNDTVIVDQIYDDY